MYFHSVVYTLYNMKVMSNLNTQTTHTSVLFGDLAEEGKVKGRGKVWSKYESYDHTGIT